MAQFFNVFPQLPAHTQTVQLEDQEWQVRLVWQERNQSWYLDLLDADGTALLRGRRVSPLMGPTYRMPVEGLDGEILCIGRDPYLREDLGGAVVLLYLSPDEIDGFRRTSSVPEVRL